MNELAELAKLDGLIGGKKEETSMASAMSRNEKIREWVRIILKFSLFLFFLYLCIKLNLYLID